MIVPEPGEPAARVTRGQGTFGGMKRGGRAGVMAGVLFGASVSATPVRPPAHQGWMLRAAIGAGYDDTAFSPVDVSLNGASMSSHLAIGGYVIPNLALHATLWNGLVFSPHASGGTFFSGGIDFHMSCTGFGAGITYVLPSIDVFASVSGGVATISAEATTGPTRCT